MVWFYDEGQYDAAALRYVVIMTGEGERWLFARHRERTTWEVPGGHIEPGETPLEAAARELFEETGALRWQLQPVCAYGVGTNEERGTPSGLLCLARVEERGPLPPMEIAEVRACDALPAALTYPDIQPALFAKALEFSLAQGV